MLPTIDLTHRGARVHTEGATLTVDTGLVRRTWAWTASGFATTGIRTNDGAVVHARGAARCDWQLPDGAEPDAAELTALSAAVADDEGFTSEHICVTAEIACRSRGLALRFSIWVYPDASGVRTHLALKRDAQVPAVPDRPKVQGEPPEARIESLPIAYGTRRRRLFGYYNQTQQRNDTHQDILKEHVVPYPLVGRELADWASVACVEDDAGGGALVKESHKCVNQRGHATGGFIFDDATGLEANGWGLRLEEVSSNRFTPAWAVWTVCWSGGESERQRAFKRFDRLRYPIDPKRDVYVQANTWGSTATGADARRAACEPGVLAELASCADLGIDYLQIDDGWQVPPGHPTWKPEKNGWNPHPESYPDGWATIRARAREFGVGLGLWAAAQSISLDELKRNFEAAGFRQYKLDFADLKSRAQIDELMDKVRAFVLSTGHTVRVNWDVTEIDPRYGYFFAREYGCIYLENRKPERPISTVYRPHTVLRDLWQIAKYVNLHRFQGSVQNVDRVDPARSDAHLHGHDYATAIALMSIPLFFQQTQFYSEEARAQIRPLLAAYKKHREAIYSGVVYPIGASPDNGSWTGFQCHLEDGDRGYLTIFRERCNTSPSCEVKLHYLAGKKPRVADLMRSTTREVTVGPAGSVPFTIERAPGFLFCSYDVV